MVLPHRRGWGCCQRTVGQVAGCMVDFCRIALSQYFRLAYASMGSMASRCCHVSLWRDLSTRLTRGTPLKSKPACDVRNGRGSLPADGRESSCLLRSSPRFLCPLESVADRIAVGSLQQL